MKTSHLIKKVYPCYVYTNNTTKVASFENTQYNWKMPWNGNHPSAGGSIVATYGSEYVLIDGTLNYHIIRIFSITSRPSTLKKLNKPSLPPCYRPHGRNACFMRI